MVNIWRKVINKKKPKKKPGKQKKHVSIKKAEEMVILIYLEYKIS